MTPEIRAMWERDERAIQRILAEQRASARPMSKLRGGCERSVWRLVSWLAENVAFISWHKHWKGVYLHCVHPKYCVRLFAWGIDWHLKAKHALRKPANAEMTDANRTEK